jgi:hypothetical protein
MSTNQEKLEEIIKLLGEIQDEPKSWDKGTKAKIIYNIRQALKLALLMRT